MIFETLNSRGKPLEVQDLLKNHFYAILDKSHQPLKEKWVEMVSKTDGAPQGSSTQFIKYYWNSFNKLTREKDLFSTIVKSEELDKYEFLEGLFKASNLYVAMLDFRSKTYFKDDEVISILKLLREIKATSFFPLIMAMDRCGLKSEMKRALHSIETMILRNQVVMQKTANRNEVFFSLRNHYLQEK